MKAAPTPRRQRGSRVRVAVRALPLPAARVRLIFFFLVLLLAAAIARLPAAERGPVNVMTIEGVIDPTVANYMDRVIDRSEEEGASAVIIHLDTPGGLLDSTHTIVRRMLASRVPLIVYISPAGGRAGSAGTFITAAAHVAAMAPSTNIGAAHPVDGEGNAVADKVTNDAAAHIRTVAEKRGRNADWYVLSVRESHSITEKQALEKNVVELVANSRADLIRKLEGRVVDGRKLHLQGAPVREVPMDVRERLLHAISQPNIAYILFIIAVYGIIAELQNPGMIFPGVAGVSALLLAFYSMAVLPINAVGALLLLLGVGLMIADIKVASHGLLTATGAVAFAFGSFMLVRSPDPFLQISTRLILAATIVTTGFFAFVVGAGLRAQRRRVTTGIEGLVGQPALAKSDIAPSGHVLVEGELWQAESLDDEPIKAGDHVVIVAMDGFTLKVRKEI